MYSMLKKCYEHHLIGIHSSKLTGNMLLLDLHSFQYNKYSNNYILLLVNVIYISNEITT